ncbi:MAG TPA: hypothetical protein VMU32_00140 [Solirubrobacteraceae bacterium]|nr:hypothetical protein [Solirubrobacteraceae bacterium]
MTTRRVTLLLALMGLLALAPPAALAASHDVVATQALARAANTLVVAATPEVPRGLAAAERYATGLIAQCPNAAAGSPQNRDSEQLDNELIGAMTTVGYRVAAAHIAVFAHAVGGLRWSNARLTHAVHRFASHLLGLSKLATPNVCGDIQSWTASGFQTLPASTVAFDKRYLAITPEAYEVPLIIRLAMPYATPSEMPVLRRVERLEEKLGEAEAAAVESYSRVIIALELKQ